MNVSVIGAGAWGTTLASLLVARNAVRLWAREPEVVESIQQTRQNRLFLDGVTLADGLVVTNQLDEALDSADIVVVAVPSQYVRATMVAAQPFVANGSVIVSVTKGIELETRLRPTQALAEVLVGHDPAKIGVLSGPNLAREISVGHPAATCVAFGEATHALAVQALFAGDILRVYTSDDVVGCEIGGAAKNVIAIAAGFADGLGYGTNTKAALITRGLAELTRLGVALGGRPLTFLGLAGNGDLVATCSSPLSRNRCFGEELAKGGSVAEMIKATHTVAEGVDTAPALLALARDVGVDMPISATVDAVLRGELKGGEVVAALMSRKPQVELHDLGA